MTSLVRHVTVDCSDAARLADFWAADLGGEAIVVEDNPGEFKTTVVAPGIALLFNPVAEPKAPKNRAHFNLQPQGRGRDAEAMQLLAPGGGTGGRPADERGADSAQCAHGSCRCCCRWRNRPAPWVSASAVLE